MFNNVKQTQRNPCPTLYAAMPPLGEASCNSPNKKIASIDS